MIRRENIFRTIDWWTIILYTILVFFGWAMIIAVDYKGTGFLLFDFTEQHGKQFLWITLSLFLAFFLLVLDFKFYIEFSYIIYGILLVLLIATLILAPEIKGSRSWFPIGPFTFQPSEFAKTATVLALAKYLTTVNVNLKQNRTKLISLAIIFIPVALIILQGDTGSALVFMGLFIVLFREGFPVTLPLLGLYVILLFLSTILYGVLANIIVLSIVFAIITGWFGRRFKANRPKIIMVVIAFVLSMGFINFGVSALFDNVLQAHHRTRINVLLGKEYGAGADYNVMQSKIAIGSGGWDGKGYLQGTLNKGEFVPEQSTDFIFSTLGEELGFIGSFSFILIFILLLLRIVYISERQRSRYTQVYGYGVASILFMHFAINIGMTIGLVPVVGIPLPFVSYGGSSLLGFTFLIFILLKLDANRKVVLR